MVDCDQIHLTFVNHANWNIFDKKNNKILPHFYASFEQI